MTFDLTSYNFMLCGAICYVTPDEGGAASENVLVRGVKTLVTIWFCWLHHHHHHHHQSLNREGRWGTIDDFATSFLHFPCSPLPSGTCRTPGLSILWCCLPTSSSVCLVTVPCKMVLVRPDERETWPYHCSLRLFTIGRRSLCGPNACWILAWTSSLVTWSLYEMQSIS